MRSPAIRRLPETWRSATRRRWVRRARSGPRGASGSARPERRVPSGGVGARRRASSGAAASADANRSSATPSRKRAEPSGLTRSSRSRPAPAPARGERAVVLAPDEKAGTRRVGQKGRERPEEAGLLDVGPAVLGAEDVAVPAVVAGVGPVRELVRRRLRPARRERPFVPGRKAAAADDEIVKRDRPGRRLVREIRVVRADRDALVAVDAVQEVEVRSDLARQPAGLRGPVALG